MKNADIVIAACGVPGLIKSKWIRHDAVVIDVGINFVNDQSGNSIMCSALKLAKIDKQTSIRIPG